MPAIDDPAILNEVGAAMKEKGGRGMIWQKSK
jgi:hypothetical protein